MSKVDEGPTLREGLEAIASGEGDAQVIAQQTLDANPTQPQSHRAPAADSDETQVVHEEPVFHKPQPQSEAGELADLFDDLDEAIEDCRAVDNAAMEELLHRVDKHLRNQPAAGADPVAWRYWRNDQSGQPRRYYARLKPNCPNSYGAEPLYLKGSQGK